MHLLTVSAHPFLLVAKKVPARPRKIPIFGRQRPETFQFDPARMLANGMIAVRIRSTVELDGVSQMLEKLHNGGLRGKAVIRL